MDHADDVTVNGVFEDVPDHSTLQFDFVRPIEAYVRHHRSASLDDWNSNSLQLFVRVFEGVDGPPLTKKIIDIQNGHISGFRSDLFLQPYADQHLHSAWENGAPVLSQAAYNVRMFGVIALIIVLIACINFMNLGTARSMRRAREIGVRKAIGAQRLSLVGQFMGESMMLVGVAFFGSLVLVTATLPAFNTLTQKSVTLTDMRGGALLLFAGIGLLTALLSGAYPAIYLSSFDAVRVLRGTFRSPDGKSLLRRGLVVFQFAMSILLITGTITAYRQIAYIHTKDLGLDRTNVLTVRLSETEQSRLDAITDDLRSRPGIEGVTAANASPLDISNNTFSVVWPGKPEADRTDFHVLSVSHDFLKVMGMQLAAGRDFDPSMDGDSLAYLVNERALDIMGLTQPIGQEIGLWNSESGAIVGVVKDFNMSSLYSETAPTILRLDPDDSRRLFVRVAPGRTQHAIESLAETHARFNPEDPFRYGFLDENFRQTYRNEEVIGTLAGAFAAIALGIALLTVGHQAARAARADPVSCLRADQ